MPSWRLLVSFTLIPVVVFSGTVFDEDSFVVLRGALVLVVPFLLAPALNAVKLWKLFRPVPFSFTLIRLTGDEADDIAVDIMLESLKTRTSSAGGAEVSDWLRTLKSASALPPSTMLLEVRNNPRRNTSRYTSRSKDVWGYIDVGDEPEFGESSSSSSCSGDDDDEPAARKRLRGDGDPLVYLVIHIAEEVPQEKLIPIVSRKIWQGDVEAFCHSLMRVAFVEVPVSRATGIFPHDLLDSEDISAAVAAATSFISGHLGVDAVVLPLNPGDPMPFLKSILARRGAHILTTLDTPRFILNLVPCGTSSSRLNSMQDNTNVTWDGMSYGKHRKARHEYRRQQRRFEEMGGTVQLFNSERVDSVVNGSEQCELGLSTRIKRRPECIERMRWFSSRRVLEKIDAEQVLSPSSSDNQIDSVSRISEISRAGMEVAERAAVSWNDTKYDDEQQQLPVSSGGWHRLEARVNGDCVGVLLFLAQLKKRADDDETPVNLPGNEFTGCSRIVVHACWLHPTRGVRNGVLSALFRGAIDFAACRGCTSLDLGPGGANIKSRLGAQAVQPKCMVAFADWRLRAQTRAASRSELYTELLERVRESAMVDAKPQQESLSRESVTFPTLSKRSVRRLRRRQLYLARRLQKTASRAFGVAANTELSNRKNSSRTDELNGEDVYADEDFAPKIDTFEGK